MGFNHWNTEACCTNTMCKRRVCRAYNDDAMTCRVVLVVIEAWQLSSSYCTAVGQERSKYYPFFAQHDARAEVTQEADCRIYQDFGEQTERNGETKTVGCRCRTESHQRKPPVEQRRAPRTAVLLYCCIGNFRSEGNNKEANLVSGEWAHNIR